MLHEAFQCASLDIDFSENLTVLVKEEPQSLHWSNDKITVHSGILKCRGDKVTMLTCQTQRNMTKHL